MEKKWKIHLSAQHHHWNKVDWTRANQADINEHR